jgi:hypothetical protein
MGVPEMKLKAAKKKTWDQKHTQYSLTLQGM